MVAVIEEPTPSGSRTIHVERAPSSFLENKPAFQLTPALNKRLKLSNSAPVPAHHLGLMQKTWPLLWDNRELGKSKEFARRTSEVYGTILDIESVKEDQYFKIFFAEPSHMIRAFEKLDCTLIDGYILRVKIMERIAGPDHYENHLPKESEEQQVSTLSKSDRDRILNALSADQQRKVASINGITLINRDLLTLANGVDSWVNDETIDFYLSMVSQCQRT